MPPELDPANAGTPPANAATPPVETTPPAEKTPSDRLLEESKAYKLRAQAAEKALEDLKSKSLLDQGQFKDLYDAEKLKNSNLMKSVVQSTVRNAVTEIGAKSGLISVDAAMKLGNASLLQFDTESAQVVGAETFLDDLKKIHPYLFKPTGTPLVNTATPGGAPPMPTGELTAEQFAKLSPEQRSLKLAEGFKKLKG